MLRTGIDILSIEKIKKILKNENALQRLFHATELKTGSLHAEEHLAGIIAAKEAFFKALGMVPQWLDVEVVYEENGRPYLKYAGILKQKIKEADVSISHDHEYAVASVVLMLNVKKIRRKVPPQP